MSENQKEVLSVGVSYTVEEMMLKLAAGLIDKVNIGGTEH